MQLTRNIKNLDNSSISILVFILVGVIAFTLSVNFSRDWDQYLTQYRKIDKKSWAAHWSQIGFFSDALYLFTTKFLAGILGYPVFIFLVTVSLLTIKLRYLEKIVGVMFGGLFFYVCLYLFLFEGTALRIAFATAFVVPALYFLKQDRPLLALLLLLVGSQIHVTVLAFLLMFPIYYWDKSTIAAYIMLPIAPLMVIFDVSIFPLVSQIIEYVNPRYMIYDRKILANQNSTGLFFYFIAFFTMVVAVTYYYLREEITSDRFTRTLHTLSIIAIIAMCVFHDHVAVGARLGELLLLSMVILLSQLSLKLTHNGLLLVRNSLYLVFFMYFLAKFYYLYPQLVRSIL
jgi:hypothetical protein